MFKEVYYLEWKPTGTIIRDGYTDIERAKRRLDHENSRLPWRHRLFAHQYVLRTLKIKK